MTTPALDLKNVRKQFGSAEIIRGVNLSVQPGERVAIIGPNGAGKSTLFNLISGRFAPGSGEILLNGRQIAGLAPSRINRLGLSRSSRSQISFIVCPYLKISVARCCGRSATGTRSGTG